VRVDRIESQTTIVELKKLFKPFGRVLEIGILEARDGDRLSMSATVTMADPYSALDAVRQLDGFKLRGLPIEVSILED
jgi:RNA recognition motif-containing protein